MEQKSRFKWLLWLLPVPFLWWVLRSVPLNDIASQLNQLNGTELTILLGVNVIVLVLFTLRWWLVLYSQGVTVGFLPTAFYRLASFGVSYLTPGPQFGGEPVQVLLLGKHHSTPSEVAIASVTLEKTIELVTNGFVIFVGSVFIFYSGLVPAFGVGGVAGAFILMALPLSFLGLLWMGIHPLSPLIPMRGAWLTRFAQKVLESEREAIVLCQQHGRVIILAAFVSLASWVFVVWEYTLALGFLGLPLPLNEVLALVLAARIAILLPTPGGLGAVEASQLIVMEALGYDPVIGVGISIIIRARDLVFALGGVGLLWLDTLDDKKLFKGIMKP